MTRSSQTEFERVAGVLEACADAEKRLGRHPYRAKIMRRSAELLRRAGVLLRTPAEARQVLALDAIRDVLGIDYDEDSAMWYLPAEPAPIECATLDDALRAYAKMAAPASGEPSGADAAVREALDAIKKAHAAVDDLCNGRRWTMSIPARPDADPDLVIGDALTIAERVIQSLAGPTAPGAPEEGAGDAE